MLSHMNHKTSTFVQRLLSFLLCLASSSLMIQAQDSSTYIKTGKLFDGRSDKLQEGVVIVVQANKILQVGKDLVIPSGANVIDLSDLVVMPGLIDAHTHI